MTQKSKTTASKIPKGVSTPRYNAFREEGLLEQLAEAYLLLGATIKEYLAVVQKYGAPEEKSPTRPGQYQDLATKLGGDFRPSQGYGRKNSYQRPALYPVGV